MKVKIIKSDNFLNWYDKKVGEVIDVEDYNNELYICNAFNIDKPNIVGYIPKLHCANWEDNYDEKDVRIFESGAKRDGDKNKPFIHNLLGYTRKRFGYHMNKNSKKYGDNNWLKGMPTDQYLQSVDRHLADYINGDRSEDHLSAMIFGIQGCMINEQKEGIKEDYYFSKDVDNE